MKRIRGIHVWFLLSVAAAVAMPPLLLRATPSGYDACRRRVEAMPEAERERIERNFSDFLKMDPAERKHYRDMHQRLVEDQNAQGVYARLFQNYTTWVQTVEPHQQLELRATRDSEQRFDLMRRILDEESAREMGPPWLRSRLILPPDRFQAMMEAVESSVDLSQAERKELKNLEGLERTFRFFEILQEKGTSLNGRALDAVEINRIIEKGGLQPLVDAAPTDDPRPGQNMRLFVLTRVILANVGREYESEVRKHRPTEEALERVLNDLPGEDQEDLLRLPPDEFDQVLRQHYAATVAHLDFRVVVRAVLGPQPDTEGARSQPWRRRGFWFRREGGPPPDGRRFPPPPNGRRTQPGSDPPGN